MFENKISVCLLLDDQLSSSITKLQKKLGRMNTSAHITIGTYLNIDPTVLIEYTKSFCSCHSQINIDYIGIGILSDLYSILYAIPRTTFELLNLYTDFHQEYDEYCNEYTSLSMNKWVPHSTLCRYSGQSIDDLIQHFKYMEGKVVGIKLVLIEEDEFIEMGRYYLSKPDLLLHN